MTKSLLLGISLTSVFVVSMIISQSVMAGAPPGYLDITNAKLVESQKNVKMHIKVAGNTDDGIDPDTGEGFFGYAALTEDFNDVLAVTYHEPIVDSDAQPGWHSHVVDLTTETGCVSGLAVASASLGEPGHTIVKRNNILVNQVSPDDVGSFSGAFASFGLTVEGGEVCVNPVDFFP